MNIPSLRAQFLDLEAFLLSEKFKPTISGFTETWLQEEQQAKPFKLPGYQSWGNRNGVELLIDKKLKNKVLKDTTRE